MPTDPAATTGPAPPAAIPRHPVWPPAYALLAAAAMVGADRWIPVAALVPDPWTWSGLVPLAAGGVLAGWAEIGFLRARTPTLPNRDPAAMVSGGAYAITRNPMYLSLALCLVGLWLLLGSLSPGAAIPAFVVIIDRLFIRREERRLDARFGDAYRGYAARVRRWV